MKINIIGTSGSGKSTFSRRIAEALAIPYIEMDRLYWRANWQGTPDDEFLATTEKALAASPDWVWTEITTAHATLSGATSIWWCG